MADKPLPWFRLYSEIVSDRKVAVAARVTGRSKLEIIGAFTVLMCLASESPNRGKLLITGEVPYSLDDLAHELGLDEQDTENILSCFQMLEMIEIPNGVIAIKNWNKRQYKSDDSSERVTKFRMKQDGNVTVTPIDRYSNVSVTHSEAEAEAEADTDTEAEAEAKAAAEVYRTYTSEIGLLTPMISDDIDDAIKTYPQEWIIEAIKEAARNNARTWKYILAILKRWKVDGFKATGKNRNNGVKPATNDTLRRLEARRKDGSN